MWSKKTNSCLACESTEREHKARGYCQKCYPIVTKIEIVKAWVESDNKTLKPISGFSKLLINQCINSGKFKKSKTEILRQLETRLAIIKNSVNPSNVDGMAIERLLSVFAELILQDKGKNMFRGHVDSYDLKFSEEQRKIIFKDLNAILAKRRFTLDLTEILLR